MTLQNDKLRDKILTITASVIGSVLLMFLGLYSTGIATETRTQQIKLDSKLDKVEFEKHCESSAILFDRINSRQEDQLSKINETLSRLMEQNAKISTDVDWIKTKVK